MKKFDFFSIYILINGIVLALVVGMSAAAFSMSPEGLLILEAPTTATTSANTRGAMVAKVEVEKDKIKKAIKQVAGGCEMWESTDFFRIRRWGAATSLPYSSSSMICNCPSGFTKIQIRTRQENINDFSSGDWYNRYSTWDGGTAVPCGPVTSTASHIQVNSCATSSYGQNSYENKFCFHTACYDGEAYGEGGCNCSTYLECRDRMDIEPVTRRDNFFDFVFRIKPVMALPCDGPCPDGCSIGGAVGCGPVSMCQYRPLSVSQPTTITTWLCVASTSPGWDNNWGLP